MTHLITDEETKANWSIRVSTMGLSNAKCKVHLAYRPRIHSATGWLKWGEAKFFWHSTIVPSHMWDGIVVPCQNNLVYFNPFKPLSLATVPGFALSIPSLSPAIVYSLSPAIVKLLSLRCVDTHYSMKVVYRICKWHIFNLRFVNTWWKVENPAWWIF